MRDTRLVADPIPIPAGRPEPPRFVLISLAELRRLTVLGQANFEAVAEGEGGKRPLRLAFGLAGGLERLERAASGERP